MATENILPFEELLAPISPEQPCGVDLRLDESADSLYYLLKDARNNARAIERNSFPGDENNADQPERKFWKTILTKAPEALKQSKDLEISAWLTEALLREYGFAGLRDGLALLNALVNQFWDGLYPLPDEDGISTRVAVLVGLNGIKNNGGTLIAPINTAPLTKDGLYSAWSYAQAREFDKIKDAAAKKKKAESGAVSVDTIKASIKPSASEFYFNLQDDISIALEQFAQLSEQLEQLCGDDVPPTSAIRKNLEKALSVLQTLAKDILNPVETFGDEDTLQAPNEDGIEPSLEPMPDTMTFKASSNIQGRLEAFKTLQQVADFFKHTEPHSPIGYTLERVVRWGDMSLPELLQELIPDPNAKLQYEKLVGILPPPPPQMAPQSQMAGGMPPQPGMDPMMPNQYHDPGMMNQNPNGFGYQDPNNFDNPIY